MAHFGKLLARGFLKVTGWEIGEAPPDATQFVLIAAPHTSNWDLAYLLCYAAIFDLKISWMGKHSLFRPPMGWVLRSLGGIPVVRHRRTNVVESAANLFSEHDPLCLVIPAEGTRRKTTHWKSGFYHIARVAKVPIVCSYLDYRRRRGGFGPVLAPSGSVKEDMDEIRAFYSDKTGRHPELFGEVRLKEEEAAADPPDAIPG